MVSRHCVVTCGLFSVRVFAFDCLSTSVESGVPIWKLRFRLVFAGYFKRSSRSFCCCVVHVEGCKYRNYVRAVGGTCFCCRLFSNLTAVALLCSEYAPSECSVQGNYLQALECMERGLVLRQHFFGSDSEEVWCACTIVGEMCNLLAMTYLQQEDFGMVLELLKKAEILTERDEAGRAVTYNNLACYYRRRGKLHAALQYLQKALKIEAKMVRITSRLRSVYGPAPYNDRLCTEPNRCAAHEISV